jgi:hypothetical protein
MYEPHHAPLLSRAQFLARYVRHLGVGMGMILVSLWIGMAGYEHYEALPWRDAFLNAAMLLGGMGPVDPIRTESGKIFAGLYALYAGLLVLAVAGLLVAPIAHRLLHRFHLPDQ